MDSFDLEKDYIDYTGDKLIVTSEKVSSERRLVRFEAFYSGEVHSTYSYFGCDKCFHNDHVPDVDTLELRAVARQLDEVEQQEDKELRRYLSSVLLALQAGLPRPTKDDWIAAYSCHDAECLTPFVAMTNQADWGTCVRVEIPYTQMDTRCTLCRVLRTILLEVVHCEASSDLENTWIFAHIQSGGLKIGKFWIVAPNKNLDEIELNTFLRRARDDDSDNAFSHITLIHANTLIWHHDVMKNFGMMVECSLYYESCQQSLETPILPSFRPLSVHPLDDTCISFIKACWRECEVNHKSCTSVKEHSLRPSRLIHVGEDSQSTVCLLDDGIGEHKYAALSYCWGGSDVSCLTTATIEGFSNEIPWHDLSRTHRDAIQVARKLSIAYLWIDALCIVQDDRSDWLEESSKMRDIYSSAELVICADNSEGTDSGFLRERLDEHQWPTPEAPSYRTMEGRTPNEEMRLCIWTRKLHGPDDKGARILQVDDRPWNRHILHGELPKKEPISQRAWCLQEYLSAKRCVRFTSQEVIWDCRSQIKCECGRRATTPGKTGLFKQKFHNIMDRETLPSESLLRQWRDIVQEFSNRQLTRQTDQLAAIAGIAREFAAWGCGTYVAGHFEGTLLSTLLWGPPDPISRFEKELRLPYEYVAPSWSWASISECVDLLKYAPVFTGDHDPVSWSWTAETIGGESNFVGPDEFGPVTSGYIRLAAPVLQAIFDCPEPIPRQDPKDGAMTETLTEATGLIFNSNLRIARASWHNDHQAFVESESDVVFCVVIYQNHDKEKGMNRYVAMVVIPEQQKRGIYADLEPGDEANLRADTSEQTKQSDELVEQMGDLSIGPEERYVRVGIAEIWSDNGDERLNWPVQEILLA